MLIICECGVDVIIDIGHPVFNLKNIQKTKLVESVIMCRECGNLYKFKLSVEKGIKK